LALPRVFGAGAAPLRIVPARGRVRRRGVRSTGLRGAGDVVITVHKFPVPLDSWTVSLVMPRGAIVLSVASLGSAAWLYALVDTNAPDKLRRFAVLGTGKDASGVSPGLFVGTFQVNGGQVVGHVFDLGEI
jgi:hypothetical protein